MASTAAFTISASPSVDPTTGDRGYEGSSGETLTLQLEDNPATDVQRTTFAVNDVAVPSSPVKSEDAPVITFTGSGTASEQAATPISTVDIDLPVTTTAQSYEIRCTINSAAGTQTFTRTVSIRNSLNLRKLAPAEQNQFHAKGWSQTQNEMVDEIAGVATTGTSTKVPARIATTIDHALTGLAAIDGVTPIAGDRILVKNQAAGAENGVYIAAAGAWSRSTDFDDDAEVFSGVQVYVEEGTANATKVFFLSTVNPITVGVTALVFIVSTVGSLTDVLGVGNSTGATDIDVTASDNINYLGEVSVQRQGADVLTTTATTTVLNNHGAGQNIDLADNGSPVMSWDPSIAPFNEAGFVGIPGSGVGAGFAVVFVGGTGGSTSGLGGATIVAGGTGGGPNGGGGLLTLGGGVPTGAGTPGLINVALAGITHVQFASSTTTAVAASGTMRHAHGYSQVGRDNSDTADRNLVRWGVTATDRLDFGNANTSVTTFDGGSLTFFVGGATQITVSGTTIDAQDNALVTDYLSINADDGVDIEAIDGSGTFTIGFSGTRTGAGDTLEIFGQPGTTGGGPLNFQSGASTVSGSSGTATFGSSNGVDGVGTTTIIAGNSTAGPGGAVAVTAGNSSVAAPGGGITYTAGTSTGGTDGVHTFVASGATQLLLSETTADFQDNAVVTSGFIATTAGSVRIGGTISGVGDIRVANNTTIVSARNAGDTANLSLVSTDGSDNSFFGEKTNGNETLIEGTVTTRLRTAGQARLSVNSTIVAITVPTIGFGINAVAPRLRQDNETGAVHADDLIVQAQNNTNAGAFDGGAAVLAGGTSSNGTAGNVLLQVAGATQLDLSATLADFQDNDIVTTGFVSAGGATVASAGVLRGPNNVVLVAARNAGNTNNVNALQVTSSDIIVIGHDTLAAEISLQSLTAQRLRVGGAEQLTLTTTLADFQDNDINMGATLALDDGGAGNILITGVTPGAGVADALTLTPGASVAGSNGASVTVKAGNSTATSGPLFLEAGDGTGAAAAGSQLAARGGNSTGAAPAGSATFAGGAAAGSGAGGTATIAGGTSGSGTPGNVVAQVAGSNQLVLSDTLANFQDNDISTTGSLRVGSTTSGDATADLRVGNNTTAVSARNAGDTANISVLGTTGADAITIGDAVNGVDVNITTGPADTLRLQIAGSNALRLTTSLADFSGLAVVTTGNYSAGTTPSTDTAADFLAGNNTTIVSARNAGNTANLDILYTDSSDNVIVGGAAALSRAQFTGSQIRLQPTGVATAELKIFASAVQLRGMSTLAWFADVVAPRIEQIDDDTATLGDTLTVQAQSLITAAGTKNAGKLALFGGDCADGTVANIGGDVDVSAGKGSGTGASDGVGNLGSQENGSVYHWQYDGTVMEHAWFGVTRVPRVSAYTRNTTVVTDKTLLASASATTINNNNVLAAIIADLQSYGLFQGT